MGKIRVRMIVNLAFILVLHVSHRSLIFQPIFAERVPLYQKFQVQKIRMETLLLL